MFTLNFSLSFSRFLHLLNILYFNMHLRCGEGLQITFAGGTSRAANCLRGLTRQSFKCRENTDVERFESAGTK